MFNEDFASLFSGLKRAYGIYKIKGKTLRKPITDDVYKEHLSGKKSIGVVPINEKNNCVFGAIDIDIDDIDHVELARKVEGKGVIVCRSKSGGAHVYGFTSPIKASKMRMILSDIASSIGYGNSEIFPKQDRLNEGDVGNWINLPYFDQENTIRYGVDTNGKMSLEAFIEEAKRIINNNIFKNNAKTAEDYRGMPPCLRHFIDNGIPSGARNEVLYNLGVYLKKKGEDHWEDKLAAFNYDLIAKPLPVKDVDQICRSLKRKDYNYKCKDSAIVDYCNKGLCSNLDFGARIPEINYDEVPIGRLQKVEVDPPRWVIDVEGVDIEMDTKTLWDYRLIRLRVMETCHKIIKPLKQERWLKELQKRLENLEVIEAPKEASRGGQIVSALNEFLMLHQRAKAKQDIMRGIPVKSTKKEGVFEQEVIYFRSMDFHSYLKRKKINTPPSESDFWMLMRRFGCQHTRTSVQGRTVNVWFVRYDVEMEAPILDPLPDELEM